MVPGIGRVASVVMGGVPSLGLAVLGWGGIGAFFASGTGGAGDGLRGVGGRVVVCGRQFAAGGSGGSG
jgi:hypothetical protein